jgi:hypothetical protein
VPLVHQPRLRRLRRVLGQAEQQVEQPTACVGEPGVLDVGERGREDDVEAGAPRRSARREALAGRIADAVVRSPTPGPTCGGATTSSVYAATKTAVRVISEGLRQEAGDKLRVT